VAWSTTWEGSHEALAREGLALEGRHAELVLEDAPDPGVAGTKLRGVLVAVFAPIDSRTEAAVMKLQLPVTLGGKPTGELTLLPRHVGYGFAAALITVVGVNVVPMADPNRRSARPMNPVAIGTLRLRGRAKQTSLGDSAKGRSEG